MNYRLLSKTLGIFGFALALAMAPSILWAAWFREGDAAIAIALSIASAVILSAVLTIVGRGADTRMWQREALALVSVSWFFAGILGALPFVFAGMLGPVDAFFESISGFTTTGSTVIQDIEAQPKSILFWRGMTQWLGGVGIVVLFLAVLPYLGAGGKQLFTTESTGPDPHGMTPRIRDTVSILYKLYGFFTLAMTVILMAGGLNFYDALYHTMTTISSGGFSPKQASIGAYDSLYVEVVVICFMGAAGTSFALFFVMLRKDWFAPLRDTEWRTYAGVFFASTILVAVALVYGAPTLGPGQEAEAYSWAKAFRASAFQVMSVFTTTGYITEDFDTWPGFARVLLFALMFCGGCAGSTAGGIKVVRFVILAKIAYWRVESTFRPKTVRAIRVNEEVIDDDTRKSIHSFFVIHVALFAFGSLFMAALGLPFESALSAVAATLNNIGPGLGLVGATQDFAHIPAIGKIFLSLYMVAGRLELFSVCVLFVPSFWKHS